MSNDVDHHSGSSPGTPGEQIGDGSDTAFTESHVEDSTASTTESSARNISDASSSEMKAAERAPLRRDPALDEFDREVGEAKRLQGMIVETESEIDDGTKDLEGRLADLEIDQILVFFRVMKLIAEGNVSTEAVDRYAGVKPHGNQKIANSHLMRAIVAQGATKGTRTARRRQQRATTYAGAVDHALRVAMTEGEFRAELEGPRKQVGQYHGIEDLAKKGRAARRKEQSGGSVPSPEAMPYTVSGDFTGIKPGDHLLLITVAEGAAEMAGALLVVDEKMIRRARAADEKARSKAA
jgi:hypothetical protein